METFRIRFQDDSQNVSVHLHVDEIVLATTFDNVIKVSDYERYDGEYRVVPDFVGTTLEVGQKVSERNIEVVGIPVYKTENIGGGYTVVIGGRNGKHEQ